MPRSERRSEKKTGYSCRVNILKYVKVADKWRFAPAQLVNNKLKFDWVLIDGKPQRHAEGTYYVEWYEDGQRRRQSVKDSADVLEQARRKAIALDAGKTGLEITEEEENAKLRLADAVTAYLREIEPPQREPKTYTAYKYCLELFRASCSKTYIQDVTREDVLAFIRKLYDMGCGARTAYNRAAIVAQLLKANGIKGLLHKRDWPKYVDPIRPVYEPEELKALFAASKPEERTLYLFYLLTGMRDKEVRYCEWRDVDFNSHVVRVTAKPQWGFKPKNKEEREIPVPESLLAELKTHRERQGGNKNPRNLVFPTASGAPDKKHEWKLKRIAHKGGLNCGRCTSRHGNKCADGEFCSNWFLHKFRHTFATRNLQQHVCDIRTLQLWLGHSDLASTMVYLKAVRNKDVAARVNGSELAAFAAATTTVVQAQSVQLEA
ncbi:MAG TPA: site-specific integrase [Candidatus Angelobacter sp.]|nr:site-specific integrase [Candidatus Angelobacter sp.]